MSSILVDTGVWYAVCDPKDGQRYVTSVEELWTKIEPHSIVFPWPIAYETLRSSFAKNNIALGQFERHIKSPKIIFIDDHKYLGEAFRYCFETSLRRNRPLSMVDCLLRLMLDDRNNRIDYLATFNIKDFHDVCRNRGIEIIDH